MQVILLATGETDKLRPLTETITSPMIPVANRPVMVYTVEMLARQGSSKCLSACTIWAAASKPILAMAGAGA